MKTLTKKKKGNREPYYDINDDWDLIVASFQSEYGIRLSRELHGMSWREFAYLINGLSGESPLGRIVCIRAEKDPAVIKEFSPEQKRTRNEYLRKIAKTRNNAETQSAIEMFKQAFMRMAQ